MAEDGGNSWGGGEQWFLIWTIFSLACRIANWGSRGFKGVGDGLCASAVPVPLLLLLL